MNDDIKEDVKFNLSRGFYYHHAYGRILKHDGLKTREDQERRLERFLANYVRKEYSGK